MYKLLRDKMNTINLENSKIIEIGQGSPVVGIVGLVHGNESCGRQTLDDLQGLKPKGTVRLIYANLKAEREDVREIDSNLNRVFPGIETGNLEERTAYQLGPHLKECDVVADIHSTSYISDPFSISVEDSPEFDRLAFCTGLGKYVIMTKDMANGGSLIDYVNACGGLGISFEAGNHTDESSVMVAREVVKNLLTQLGVIEGETQQGDPEKFYAREVIRLPEGSQPNTLKNFELLPAGKPYGMDKKGNELSLPYDCHPFLVTPKMIDGKFFISSTSTIKT
jgi:predicted deacylase